MSRMSRRDLILAGGAFLASPRMGQTSPPATEIEGFTFGFFSDTHVALSRNIKENAAMFAEMQSLKPDFAINGGDVTDYGWKREYDNYRELLKNVSFPVHHVPGNHDVRWSPLGPMAYKEGTRSPMYSSFDHKGVHFVLLDSTVPLSHWGHFEKEMLDWLRQDLTRIGGEVPVVLVTHHWVGRENVMVDNEADLLPILEPYNIKFIFNGHGHSDLLWDWNGIPNTMNKGLYQGSWQLVEVDQRLGELRVARRSESSSIPKQLVHVPLARPRSKARFWTVPPVLRKGSVIWPITSSATEYRWDDQAWLPIPPNGIPVGSAGGEHRFSLRKKESYEYCGVARISNSNSALTPVWQCDLPGGVMSHLRLDDDALLVSCMDGSVLALSQESGRIEWSVRTGGYCHSSPVVAEGLVLVGSADGYLYAFRRKNGKQKWRFKTEGPVYASPAVSDGLVVIASGDGHVYGVDLHSGQEQWQYALGVADIGFVQSPIASDGERFYAGAWDKHLYCFGRKGQLLWRKDCVGDRSWAYSPAIGGPAVGEGRVIVPANGNNLCAFDSRTGTPLWNVSAPGDKFGYSSPTLAGDLVVIGCLGDKGEFRCLDVATGEILWTAETGSTIYDSSPCVGDGFVAIGSVSGLLTIAELKSGKVLASHRLPTGHFLSSPIAKGRRIYAATYCNRAFAFEI